MMNKKGTAIAAFLLIAFLLIENSNAQFRATVGGKAWYATWNVQIESDPGAEQSDYSPALLAGPYLSLRFGRFALTGMYSTTTKHFTATTRNPGFYTIGYNANRVLTRQDINIFANYSVLPEVSLFFNAKFLTYRLMDAYTDIAKNNFTSELNFESTGYGIGAQFAGGFSGGVPMYSFLSLGFVVNSYKAKEVDISGTELVYVIDGGVGYRFAPSALGMTLGVRVEAGEEDTIIGPTANMFYTF